MGTRMCEKMGDNMGEKRCEGKRETIIYRVRPRQIAENDVKHPEVRRKRITAFGHEDGQTGITARQADLV